MKIDIYLNAVCTKVGVVKTITSKKNGKQYKFREYDFVIDNNDYDDENDNEISEIKGYAMFADENGDIRELEEGEHYSIRIQRFYDRITRSEREFIDVL
jgi:hypothetical protein